MLDAITQAIDGVLGRIGRFVSLFVLVMAGLIIIEMTSRGLFGRSLPWAQDVSSWLLTVFVMIGGPYALLRGQFVRVDIIFARLSPKGKAIVDTVFSTVLLALFVGVLVWRGGDFFLSSFAMDERSATGSWSGPVWLAKLMVPLGGGLLGLAWLSHILHSWRDSSAGAVVDSSQPESMGQ